MRTFVHESFHHDPYTALGGSIVSSSLQCFPQSRNGGVKLLGRKTREPVVDLMKGDSGDTDTSPHIEEVPSPTSAAPFLHGRLMTADGETTLDSVSPHLHASATTSQSNTQYGGTSSSAPVFAGGVEPDSHSGARRKAVEAAVSVLTPPGHQRSTQFILHTDIEDNVLHPVDEVIELPPQYSERRGAAPAASGSHSQPQAGEASTVPLP